MRRTRTTQVLTAATAAAAIAGLTLSSQATAVTSAAVTAPIGTIGTTASAATTDSRAGALVKPTQAQADAVSAIIHASPGTRATWDARFGTPRTLTPAIGSTLSGPRSGSAVDVAKAWLSDNQAMLALSAADLDALQLRRDHVLPGTGTHVVQLIQTFGGVAAARGGSLGVVVQQDGSVLSYTGETIALGQPPRQLRALVVRRARGRRREDRERTRLRTVQDRHPGRLRRVRQGTVRRFVVRQEGRLPDRCRRPRGVLRAVHRAPRRGLPGRRRRRDRRAALQVQPRPARGRRHDLRQLPGRSGRRAAAPRVLRPHRRLPRRLRRPDGPHGHRHHDLRQQRQRARELVELHRAGRPGPAADQPDRPVRLPRTPTTGGRRAATRRPTRSTRTPRAPTSSTTTTGSTTSTTASGSPSPPATSS